MIDLAMTADLVAPRLLGSVIRCGSVSVRVHEVEAYLGTADPASHAAGGPTPRSLVMFGPPGRLYVYLSYGIHLAANIVCGPDGVASACLLRGGQVVDGLDQARRARPGVPDARLAQGPGNLGRALGLTLADSGARLGGVDDRFELSAGPAPGDVRCGPRIGISKAVTAPLRYWIPGAIGVSGPSRAYR